MISREKGYINIPGWIFVMAPIGIILLVVESFRLVYWLYQNIEVTVK